MPADYRIDESRRCVISTATGLLTSSELFQHQVRLRADSHFRRDLNQLCLLVGLDGLDVSSDAIRTLVTNSPFGAGARRALVVDSALAFGLARMFQSYADESPEEIEIFRDVDSANRWLESNPHHASTPPNRDEGSGAA